MTMKKFLFCILVITFIVFANAQQTEAKQVKYIRELVKNLIPRLVIENQNKRMDYFAMAEKATKEALEKMDQNAFNSIQKPNLAQTLSDNVAIMRDRLEREVERIISYRTNMKLGTLMNPAQNCSQIKENGVFWFGKEQKYAFQTVCTEQGETLFARIGRNITERAINFKNDLNERHLLGKAKDTDLGHLNLSKFMDILTPDMIIKRVADTTLYFKPIRPCPIEDIANICAACGCKTSMDNKTYTNSRISLIMWGKNNQLYFA